MFYLCLILNLCIARKIANHPYLLFWDEAEQHLLLDMSTEEGQQVQGKDDLIDMIYQDRDKSGKLKILESMLDDWFSVAKDRSKVLIFSQTKILLDVISKVMRVKGMKFKRIDGETNVSKRMNIIDDFSTDED